MLLMIDVETLGEKIRRLRDEQGLSLGKFAEKAGISKDGLWRIEMGKTDSPYSLTKIAAALGMSVIELRSEVIRRDTAGRITHRDSATNTPAPEPQPEGMRPIWVSADTYGQLEYLAAKKKESVETHIALYAKNSTTRQGPINPDPPSAQPPKVSPAQSGGRRKRDGKEMENANH